MLNRSADYALRAVLYLAQREGGGSCAANVVARATGMPRNYLGKVLHMLVRGGVLDSERGPRGGFRLAVEPEGLTLAAVVEPFQRLPARRICLLGNRPCDAANPCDLHGRWQGMTDEIAGFFRETTIASMLAGSAVESGTESASASGRGGSAAGILT
ncbi:MAG TPA: Rrf2 family transcriptional regulator [Longimicrobiales bacterium]|nr:Rrf2 family transcriptional regulator [Longimicrobiales bacterium]